MENGTNYTTINSKREPDTYVRFSFYLSIYAHTHAKRARARNLTTNISYIQNGQACENDANGVISAKRPYITKTVIKEKEESSSQHFRIYLQIVNK